MPRAFVVHEMRVFPNEASVGAYVEAHPDRLRQEVLFDGGSRPPLATNNAPEFSPEERVVIRDYRPNSLTVDVRLAREGYVVMSESHMAGWKATLDGRPVAIERANYVFRAVRVGPGEHTIRMTYFPPPLFTGLMLTLASLALLFIVLIFLL